MNNTAEISTVTLEIGDYQASFVSVGAAIASLKSRGRNLVHPHTPGQVPPGYLGQALLPWPNRITDGVYRYGGVEYAAPINDHPTNSALHGLAYNQNWQVVQATATSVTFATLVPAQPCYPFSLAATATYSLDAESGLTASITARNVGESVAPYGVSTHPYLTCDGQLVDECLLTVPAEEVLEVNHNLAPVGLVPVEAGGVDFRSPAMVGSRTVDNAFTALPNEPWNVDLTDADAGLTVRMTSTEPWVQVFSGDNIHRRGLAVEPMTCPPDAFNSHQDLIELEPGQEHTLTFSVRAIDRH